MPEDCRHLYRGTILAMDSLQPTGKLNNYYENKQLCHLGRKWGSELLKWILKSTRKQWDNQNDILHKKQPNWVKDQEINANIWEKYHTRRNRMPKLSSILFKNTLEHTLTLQHNDKQQWLGSVQAAWNQHRWAEARSITAQWALLQKTGYNHNNW